MRLRQGPPGRERRLGPGACLLLLGLAACAPHRPLRLGIAVTPGAAEAARLAADEVNRGGGIGGRALELVVLPEGFDAPAARVLAHAQQLAADPTVLAAVGHSTSTASLAASATYQAAGVPQLAPTTSLPLFSRVGPYIFALVPGDEAQAAFLAALGRPEAADRVAIAYGSEDYGRSLAAELRRALVARGTTPVFETPFLEPPSAGDLAVLGGSLALARPTLLYWIGSARALEPVLARAGHRLPGLRVLASDAFDGPDAYAATTTTLRGVRFLRFANPAAGDPRLLALQRRYRAATGQEMNGEALLVYDAVRLLAQGLAAGAHTRRELRDYLGSLGRTRAPYQGLAGPISFPSGQAAPRRYLVAEITAAGVRPVEGAALRRKSVP